MTEQRKVLVTGASKGIGRAICHRLLDDGYAVTGIARTKPSDWPQEAAFEQVDLSDRAQLSDLLEKLAQERAYYGLVNNVGIVPAGDIESVNFTDLQMAVQLNIEVAIACTQALLPGMRDLGAGRIVNISSRAALGKTNRTIYSLTKAGLIGATRTWALELANAGITVNAIAPGPIATEFFNSVNNADDAATRKLLAGIPVGHIGKHEDVAHAVAYFIDERCSFVTGQTHYVCGGVTIGAA
ncbi:MAG: SDR family oxidoreductase [Advenella sp.]